MTLRLDANQIKPTTGPIPPKTGPIDLGTPVDAAPVEAPALAPRTGDTTKLKSATGDIHTEKKVDIEGVSLEPKEKEFEAGAPLETFGRKSGVKGLGTAGAIANLPQVALHLFEGGEKLLHDPGAAGRNILKIIEHPLDHQDEALTTYKEGKHAVKTVREVGEVVVENGKRVVENVAEHGLGKGVVEATKGAGRELKALSHDIGEAFSHKSGSGIKHIPKAIAKEAEALASERATKAVMKHLSETIPELAPKGVIGKTVQRITKAAEPVTKGLEKGVEFLSRTGDRFANAGIKALEGSAAGKNVLKAIDYMHPNAHINPAELTKAVAEGTERGTHTAVEAGKALLKKNAGHLSEETLLRATEGIERVAGHAAAEGAVKIGATVASKGLARLAPGLNIAIAVVDAHHAYKVFKDPHSTGWQKGMAGATAVFSAAAATNIPIVSQIGAGLSIATSVLENVKPAAIAHAAKAVGGAIASGASAATHWVASWF
jgi:hypothetical protein